MPISEKEEEEEESVEDLINSFECLAECRDASSQTLIGKQLRVLSVTSKKFKELDKAGT